MNFLGQKNQAKEPKIQTFPTDLTSSEIELVLRLLQTTTFPVRDIEILYNSIIKLQEQFKLRTNDKDEF